MSVINDKVFFLDNKDSCLIINFETNEVIKSDFSVIKKLKSNNLSSLMIKFFKSNGVLVDSLQKKNYFFKPTSLLFYPNFRCNLRCKYCFIDENTNMQEISVDAAKKAIELVVQNLNEENIKTFKMQFTGGGEPTLSFDIIKEIVSYAKKVFPYDYKLSIVTNGIMPEHKLRWLVDNDFEMYVSFDGLPEVQNFQRVLSSGKGSFELVNRTLRLLQKWETKFSIRSVISDNNVDDLRKIVDFSLSYEPHEIILMPILMEGRAAYSLDIKAVSEKKIYKAFRDVASYVNGKHLSSKVTLNGFSDKNLVEHNIDINGDLNTKEISGISLKLTPENFVSASVNIVSTKHKHSSEIFFGEFKNGKLIINQNKYSSITKKLENIDDCNKCIGKNNCCVENKISLLYEDKHIVNCYLLKESIKNVFVGEF